MPSCVLIIGGGLAAQRAVETLRARGHDGAIRVVCGEPVAP
jgi:succinate dehydrogenase/fumarate reductase flavoprotein subunit